ncbi:hypothetical protein Tco_0777662 [Tanacetum coccineum]
MVFSYVSLLNLAFSKDLTIDAATRYNTRASIPTLSMTFSGRAQLHSSLGILVSGSSSMCFRFLPRDRDEACSGAAAGRTE